jgi:hypothetical protein
MKRLIAKVPGIEHGHDFNVVLVERGDRYGLNDCLVHDRDDPMVEFYDAFHVLTEQPFGLFVSRYNLSTLLCDPGGYGSPKCGGICLDGTNADVWAVDGVHLYAAIGAACAATGRLAESGKW